MAEGPTDHPRPAPSDGSDPVDPTAEDRDLETGHPTAECLPTTCLSTGRPDRWGTPWVEVVRWEGQWDTRGRLTAHPGDISTGRQARDPSTAQDPEDPLRDLSAVGLLGHLAVQVHLMAQADRVRLTGQADPWEGLLAPSAVLVHPSEMGSVEAAAAVAAWGEAAWDEADLETDQVIREDFCFKDKRPTIRSTRCCFDVRCSKLRVVLILGGAATCSEGFVT